MKKPNTLALIRKWSMDGARGIDGHFGSPVDIIAVVAERDDAAVEQIASPAPPPVLLKPAGEDDWRPLLAGT